VESVELLRVDLSAHQQGSQLACAGDMRPTGERHQRSDRVGLASGLAGGRRRGRMRRIGAAVSGLGLSGAESVEGPAGWRTQPAPSR
jgi:hypothetical protein